MMKGADVAKGKKDRIAWMIVCFVKIFELLISKFHNLFRLSSAVEVISCVGEEVLCNRLS